MTPITAHGIMNRPKTMWAALFAGREVIDHHLHFDAAWLLQKLGVRLSRMCCTWTAAKLVSNGDPGNGAPGGGTSVQVSR